MSLIKKPIFWVATVGLGTAGFVLTSPEEGVAPKAKAPRTSKSAVAKKGSTFTKEDEEASFKPLNVTFKNSFRPVVIRSSGGFGSGEGAANMIPPDFAGGSTGWVYTGSAEIDGAPSALLENRSTGDGVFLRAGERWKSASVVKITPTSVIMDGPSGTKTFTLVDESLRSSTVAANTQVPPAQVSNPQDLRGPIGNQRGRNAGNMGGMNIQAVPSGGMNMGGFSGQFEEE